MKRLENNQYDREAMIRELEAGGVPEAVDRKLRQVYAELPDELPVRKRGGRPVWKVLVSSVSAAAAACVMLFGLNAMNPALAEGLPFVGSIFQRINEPGPANLRATREKVQQYAQPAAAEEQVPAGEPGEKPMVVSAREAYFDGAFLYVSLELEVDSQEDLLHDSVVEGYDVVLDGQGMFSWNEKGGLGLYAQGFTELSRNQWQREERGRYIAQRSFLVPEEYRDADSLEVSLRYNGLFSHRGDVDETVNSTPFSLDFTVAKNDADVKRIEGGLETGGVRLVSAVATPAGTAYTLEYPGDYRNPDSGARFADGSPIGALGETNPQEMEGGYTRITHVFGGLETGESRNVVYSVFDKNGGQDYVAVFLLDFANGTVSTGTAEDVVSLPSLEYACGWEKLETLSQGYLAARAFFKSGSEDLHLVVATPEEYREVKVELFQGGQQIGEAVSEDSTDPDLIVNFNRRYRYWDYGEDGERGEPRETGLNAYYLDYPSLALDRARDVTVRVTDNATGELLWEEDIALTEPPVPSAG